MTEVKKYYEVVTPAGVAVQWKRFDNEDDAKAFADHNQHVFPGVKVICNTVTTTRHLVYAP